ncbi:4'-phosphopantetheinyl transferase superfamily protein [Streptomyces sp. SID3212]|uniref:4'-phosphopantetheinyl transferase family protein n=1 Tax=Streptomyces sp. SID3212 TaxID=2690259 RepID=UPI00136EE246|nr:4'-phosphopantetheinyl transferase superfamily protein [Streptomyces sp. SID3212]MYV56826.1 4'-phosphopantetheinyl transferase superfamily protein [Streptomyces sp. SID3212]
MAFTHGTPKGEHTRQPPHAVPGATGVPGTDGEAHVWWWRPPAQLDPSDLALLGTEEFRRALSLLAERDAAAFAHNRAAARRALAGLLGIAPESVELGRHRCPGCGDRGHGPPRVVAPESAAPLAISMSRTADCGVFALGAGTTIGVDVETVRPMREASLSGSVLTDNESAHLLTLAPGPARDAGFHRIWTRKEAVVKAAGLGLVGTVLNRLETWPAHRGPVRVLHTYAGRTTAWAVQDLWLGDTVAAAVARPQGDRARGPVHIHPVPRTETSTAPDPEGT